MKINFEQIETKDITFYTKKFQVKFCKNVNNYCNKKILTLMLYPKNLKLRKRWIFTIASKMISVELDIFFERFCDSESFFHPTRSYEEQSLIKNQNPLLKDANKLPCLTTKCCEFTTS